MTATLDPTASAARRTGRVVQRLVFPLDRDPDVLALYVDTEQAVARTLPAADGEPQTVVVPASAPQHPEQVLGRHSYSVPAGTRASFATYFNGFPASYWRAWTGVESVRLTVSTRGQGMVHVYRSTADGRAQRVDSLTVGSGGSRDSLAPGGPNERGEPHGASGPVVEGEFDLSLKPFVDGGWYWFDVVASSHGDLEVIGATWSVDERSESNGVDERSESNGVDERSESNGIRDDGAGGVHLDRGTVTVAITTFNRPEFCARLLAQLAGAPDVLRIIDEVIVVDQGTQKVAHDPGFAAAEAGLGGRLRVIDQANLGGSGGFARGMVETLQADRSRYVLLLDDDVVCEPESILRAATFADQCRQPTIVGGHMFSLYARSTLHSLGEVVLPWRFWWDSAPAVTADHDLAAANLRATPWLHRRIDVDYNGWWMSLIPVSVLRQIGLALPVFIKWDDAEYGLRARDAGIPTVSLPGTAVWHVPWTDKDDALDWQAYFHQRNRFVAALLHSPFPRGGRLVRESLNHQIKHLLAMQYSTAELRLRALEDLLAGPDELPRVLPTKLGEVRALRAGFPDAQTQADLGSFPAPWPRRPPRGSGQPQPPTNPVAVLANAARGVVRQARPVRPGSEERPEKRVAAMDARWWLLSRVDSAVVSMPDGTSAAWYRRDRAQFAALLNRSVEVHRRLLVEWPRLRERYREAAGRITSPETWRAVFDGSLAGRPGPQDGSVGGERGQA